MVGQRGQRSGAGPERAGPEGLGQPGQADLQVLAGPLDQAVGVEHQRVAGGELEVGVRVTRRGPVAGQAQRQPGGHLDPGHRAVGVPHQRRQVPRVGRPHPAGGERDLGIQAGGEPVGLQFGQERRGPGQHRAAAVPLGGVGGHRDPQLPHDRGRLGVVALHVADRHPDHVVPQRHRVVPVPADPDPLARGAVAHRERAAHQLRSRMRQHGVLQTGGDLPGLVEQHGPLQRLRDGAGQRGEQGPVLAAEAALALVDQGERADRAALGGQRQEGGGGGRTAGQLVGQVRVAAQEGLARGEEGGLPVRTTSFSGRGSVSRARCSSPARSPRPRRRPA